MQQFILPNGHAVWGRQRAETLLLWRQVQGYFKHGIAVQAGDVVIDVGANSGLFALLACDWGQRPLRLLALEPIPAVHAMLQANLRSCAGTDDAMGAVAGAGALCCAAGAAAGTLHMTYYPRASMLSTAYPQALHSAHTHEGIRTSLAHLPARWRWLAHLPSPMQHLLIALGLRWALKSHQLPCPVRTLSSLIDEHDLPHVHLLKIDAERAELAVLHGIEAAHWPRIEQIVLEVHDMEGRLSTIRSLLSDKGFTRVTCEQEEKMKAFDVWQVWAKRS